MKKSNNDNQNRVEKNALKENKEETTSEIMAKQRDEVIQDSSRIHKRGELPNV